jgi:hypothetical protein
MQLFSKHPEAEDDVKLEEVITKHARCEARVNKGSRIFCIMYKAQGEVKNSAACARFFNRPKKTAGPREIKTPIPAGHPNTAAERLREVPVAPDSRRVTALSSVLNSTARDNRSGVALISRKKWQSIKVASFEFRGGIPLQVLVANQKESCTPLPHVQPTAYVIALRRRCAQGYV